MRTLDNLLSGLLPVTGLAGGLGEWFLKGALLLLAAMLLERFLRDASAATRHRVLAMAFLAIISLPLAHFFSPTLGKVSVLTVRAEVPSVPTKIYERPTASNWAPTPETAEKANPVLASSGMGPVPAPQVAQYEEPKPPPIIGLAGHTVEPLSRTAAVRNRWLFAAVLLWGFGAAYHLLRLVLAHRAVRRLEETSEPVLDGPLFDSFQSVCESFQLHRPVRLMLREGATVPMTWGWHRPVVLAPSDAVDWDEDRWRVVLLHELAHVARFDCLTQFMVRVACALHWCNPMAWSLARRMDALREQACDDLVLRGGARASEYARHLVDLSRNLLPAHAAPVAALAMARPSDLEQRVMTILDPKIQRAESAPAMRRLATAAAMVLVLALGTLRVSIDAQPTAVDIARYEQSAKSATTSQNANALDSSVGSIWFSLASDAYDLGETEAAIVSWFKAIELGYQEGTAAVNVASAYEKMGDRAKALEWLRTAVDLGYRDKQAILKSENLRPLQGDATFEAILKDMTFAKERVRTRSNIASAESALGEGPLTPDNVGNGPRWKELGDFYAPLSDRYPSQGSFAFNAGLGLMLADSNGDGVRYFDRSLTYGYKEGLSAYNLACAYARRGEKDQALEWLEKAIGLGLTMNWSISDDTDFASLKGDERFEALVKKAERPGFPWKVATFDGNWSEDMREAMRKAEIAMIQAGEEFPSMVAIAGGELDEAMARIKERMAEQAPEIREQVLRALEEVKAATAQSGSVMAFARGADDGGRDFQRGYELHMAGKIDEAMELFAKSFEHRNYRDISAYNLACGHALQGNEAKAKEWLRKAGDYATQDRIADDDDFDKIREDAAFKEFVRSLPED